MRVARWRRQSARTSECRTRIRSLISACAVRAYISRRPWRCWNGGESHGVAKGLFICCMDDMASDVAERRRTWIVHPV